MREDKSIESDENRGKSKTPIHKFSRRRMNQVIIFINPKRKPTYDTTYRVDLSNIASYGSRLALQNSLILFPTLSITGSAVI